MEGEKNGDVGVSFFVGLVIFADVDLIRNVTFRSRRSIAQYFGHVGASLFLAGAAFSDVGASLFVAGALVGVICRGRGKIS